MYIQKFVENIFDKKPLMFKKEQQENAQLALNIWDSGAHFYSVYDEVSGSIKCFQKNYSMTLWRMEMVSNILLCNMLHYDRKYIWNPNDEQNGIMGQFTFPSTYERTMSVTTRE